MLGSSMLTQIGKWFNKMHQQYNNVWSETHPNVSYNAKKLRLLYKARALAPDRSFLMKLSLYASTRVIQACQRVCKFIASFSWMLQLHT